MEKQTKKSIVISILIVLIVQIFLPIFENISYATDTEVDIPAEGWDVSKEQDGSIIAKLYEDGTLTISGKGEMHYFLHNAQPWEGIEDTIKTVIIGQGVTSIGSDAFYECKNLLSIEIPDSVTSIDSLAFAGCESLTSIEIPNSVTSIGGSAFNGCESLTTIEIPDSVMSMGSSVFGWCSNLTSIKLSEGITRIGNYAFCGCSNLTSIKLPEGVKSIGERAFCECGSLTEIEMPESVESIGRLAFGECDSLTSIEIPEGVTDIGESAFYGCDSLTSIEIPKGVTRISSWMFGWCQNLTSIKLPEEVIDMGESVFNQCKSLTSIEIPKGVTRISSWTFGWCQNLTGIKLPEGVTDIGEYAFYQCESLTSIEIPKGVISIGKWAFRDCASLTSINIPEGVVNIGESAFGYSDSLRNIEIPESLESISSDAFNGCISLEQIKVRGNNKYTDINGILYNKDKTQLIRYPEGRQDKTYTIEEGVTNIGELAFYNCESLINIEIPKGLTTIGKSAFYSCNSIRNIEIPETVTSIGESAFSYCDSIRNIEIPESITNIGESAFYGAEIVKIAKKNEEIPLPDILKRIQDNEDILYSEGGIETTNCEQEEEKININSFDSLATMRVKNGYLEGLSYKIIYNELDVSKNQDGSVTAYLNEEGDLEISGSGEMEDYYNNYYYSNAQPWEGIEATIKTVTIKEGVTSIGSEAFRDCESLTSIKIPDGVTNIGESAFRDCESLTSIKIPDGVTNIGESAFSGCKSLISIKIPEGVTNIGDDVFNRCTSLTSIEIPESVENINLDAFNSCERLEEIKVKENNNKYADINGVLCSQNGTTIIKYPEGKKDDTYTIEEGVTNIGELAFYNCESLINIEIPESLENISSDTFNSCANLEQIKVRENNNKYTDIDGILYSKDKTQLIRYPEGRKDNTYTIEEGVTSIGSSAFWGCKSLTSIEIPEGVESIGESAFIYCDSLRNIEIPEGVENIRESTFRSCNSLINIEIPNSVTSIDSYAFSWCWNLASIEIPNSVTSIDSYAFGWCDNLAIEIPESVTRISSNAFAYSEDITIICKRESVAEAYAKGNNMNYTVDDEAPIVGFLPSTIEESSKQIKVAVKAKDKLSGLNESSLKYLLTTKEDGVTADEINTEFSNGEIIEKAEGTGIYYLWIYAEDMLGNEAIIRSKKINLDNISPNCSIEYSEINPTNQNVIVTITANEKVQPVEGWEVSEDETTLTKIYETNQKETIAIKDIAGNDKTVDVEISNIDKTAAEVDIDYSSKEQTNQNVIVTITANEKVQSVEGWEMSEDEKILRKIYETNKKDIITVKDLVGNGTTVEVEVGNIDKEVAKVEVDYSTKEQTNQNITVTITVNEKIQAVEGWELSEDETKLTKTYNENAEEEIIIKDLLGNETKVEVAVANIDKTTPNAEVNYSTKEQTKEKVTATIVANEKIQAVEGWEISEDQMKLIKIYDRNAEEEITVKDLAGNETKVKIEIANIEDYFEIEGYTITEDNYISGIMPETTIESIAEKIKTNQSYVIKEKGTVIEAGTVKTGQVIEAEGTVYTLVVRGDANGTGTVDLNDAIKVLQHLAGGEHPKLTGANLKAAELLTPGKVTLNDVIRIMRYKATNGAETL